MKYDEDKTQVIEMTEAALADDPQLLVDEEREDVAETMERTSPQPEAAMVSEIVLDEDAVHTETAVVEPLTELTLAAQAQTAVVVEDITFVSSEGPIFFDETVLSELQKAPGLDSSCDVVPPEDTEVCEPKEAPEIQKEEAENTPEVASVVKTTTASEAPLEFLEAGEVAPASLSEDADACEESGPSEPAILSETSVLGNDASTGKVEDASLIEAQAQEEPLEPCQTIAPCETGVQLSVAPQEVTLLEEPAAALAEAPDNWEASEHAEASRITEPTTAPAPEEECEGADLDLEEEVPASLPVPSQTFSEEDLPPQAETMNTESLAESAGQEDATVVEYISADLGTVSIFR